MGFERRAIVSKYLRKENSQLKSKEELLALKKQIDEMQDKLASLNSTEIETIRNNDGDEEAAATRAKLIALQEEIAALSPEEIAVIRGLDGDKDKVTKLSAEELDDISLDAATGGGLFFVPVVAVAGANVVVALNAAANLNAAVSANAAAIANVAANANVTVNANAT